jgi:hypothetical protein
LEKEHRLHHRGHYGGALREHEENRSVRDIGGRNEARLGYHFVIVDVEAHMARTGVSIDD